MAKKKTVPGIEVLDLNYNLAELPSSQHRAGLAGLILMVQWLKRQGAHKGICAITQLDERGATLRINQEGLAALFDEVYAAYIEEKEEDKPRPKKKPLREIKREVTKKGETEEKIFYIYPVYIPKASLVADYDPSANGLHGAWVKLWRDMYFTIIRGRDRQRIPFKSRAENEPTNDAEEAWKTLSKPPDNAVKMPSTFFIGAQDSNAEDVPFKDRARFHFLLHFWPYTTQIYVPRFVDNEGMVKTNGFVLAIPDVADLSWFCEELPILLRNRNPEVFGYRPKSCFVDVSIEGALDTLNRLQERITVLGASLDTLVLGIDVFHAYKPPGNPHASVEIKGVARVTPEAAMMDEYSRLQHALWNPLVKRQRLLNLVNNRPWYYGFDEVLKNLPYKKLFSEQYEGFKHFRHDLRWLLSPRERGEQAMPNEILDDIESEDSGNQAGASYEVLVYRVISVYIRRKLKSKYELEWDTVKNDPSKRDEYKEMKEKVAREAFLAVRSRNGMDFTDYFASTLCSVSQPLSEQQYVKLAQALYEDTDKVRTLTMLALSASS